MALACAKKMILIIAVNLIQNKLTPNKISVKFSDFIPNCPNV